MKYLNIFLFACIIHFAHSRVQLAGDSLPKSNRRLADTADKKVTRSVVTRADKTQKIAKRKLINGTMFGGIAGLTGFGLGNLGKRKQEQQVKQMKTQLEIQRMALRDKEMKRNTVLEDISKQIDETVNQFADFKSTMLQGIAQFKTVTEGKLKVYSMQPAKGLPMRSLS